MTSFLWRDSSSPDGINTVNEKAAISGLKQTVLRSKTYAMRSERTNLHF